MSLKNNYKNKFLFCYKNPNVFFFLQYIVQLHQLDKTTGIFCTFFLLNLKLRNPTCCLLQLQE